MKTTRLEGEGASHYHVMSRIIERRFYLGDEEKEMFRDMMWRVAKFSGVKILTYCVMSNHFHILIEVPEREDISFRELHNRLHALYRGRDLLVALDELNRWSNDDKVLGDIKDRYAKRMYDLSEFMKTLKQRFSFWYNKSHDRSGPLWNERFKSVLVESPAKDAEDFSSNAIRTMAAYIDLNPVRAGLVDSPEDYRWCGYAEAASGKRRAEHGVKMLFSLREGVSLEDCSRLMDRYRLFLYAEGHLGTKESRQRLLDSGGRLSRDELLRCRVRYFSDGFVLGSRQFVNRVFSEKRMYFGEKRLAGAHCMRGGEWGGLCVARDLQKNVISVTGGEVIN